MWWKMGMTIDKVIEEMEKEWKKFLEGTSLDNTKYREKELADNDECRLVVEANESTIEYLKKYEKIEQILKDIPYGGEATVKRILEVIEDGNDSR